MEVKGLRVNLAKAKVMISDVNRGPTSRKYQWGVCCKGIGSNFIFCNHCIHWVYKFCSGLNGRLDNAVDFKCRIPRTDMQMVQWMCHVSLRDRKLCEELLNRWCWHVERMDKENPVNNCRFIEVGGQGWNGRPCKTWTQLINHNLRKLKLQSGSAQNWLAWRKVIRETPSNPC